ncbi:MAG: putative Transcriptional regulator, helix-turn-helix XRE-family [Nocardioides sp.]|nr:putative Transcriptional regulator, helix-turn-helix XRE-family [Nocardioides sp.]
MHEGFDPAHMESISAIICYRGIVSFHKESTVKRPSPAKTRRAATQIGGYVLTWRKLQGLTAEQVCQRAGISRPTLRKVETGDPTVTLETFLNVLRALGRLDTVVDVLDPYESELGRARADTLLPERVRR